MHLKAISKDEIRTDPPYGGSGCCAPTGICSVPITSRRGGKGEEVMTIHMAGTQDQRNTARKLVNKAYSSRGYGDSHDIKSGHHHATFTASSSGGVIGTLTLAVDSSVGLAVDNTFREDVAPFREVPGAKICELTRFAFETNISSKHMLASLFHVIFIYGWTTFHCTDLFIEVTPRHARFYELMLGFKRVGSVKINESVSTAAQLMHLKVSEIRDRIRKYAGGCPSACASLYPYFFPPQEERGIYARLVGAA